MLKKISYAISVIGITLVMYACAKESGVSFSSNATSTGQGGSLARFAIVGNYMYAVDEQKLSVFNIQNAASPQFVKAIQVGFEIETIFPFKDKLFIGSTSVVHIFSIDNPENPAKLSQAISPTVMRRCDPVVAKDTVAYATLRTNGECGGTMSILACYDIKDITNPVQKGSFGVSEPYGLGYKDDVLYVCDKYFGLMVFDISSAYKPVKIKDIKDAQGYTDVIPYGDVLICWTSTGSVLYDISNNRNPVLLTSIN